MYGVQEAVSSTLATRTQDGCQGQQERQIRKDLALFCFLRLQSRQRLLQAVGDGTLAAYVQMAVDVRGHLDVRVAQPLLHVLQTVALRQQHAGAGVAQVVEPDMGQVVLLQQLVEGMTHIVRGVRVPVLPGEHIAVVYVVLAEMIAVVLLLLKQDFEQSNRIVCQGKAAEAGCVLRLVLLHDLRDPCYGAPYGQRLHRKVDAVPFQTKHLAAAQAVQRGDIDDRVEALVFDGGQQIAHLCFRVERTGKLCYVRHDDQIGGICLDQTVPLRQFECLMSTFLC